MNRRHFKVGINFFPDPDQMAMFFEVYDIRSTFDILLHSLLGIRLILRLSSGKGFSTDGGASPMELKIRYYRQLDLCSDFQDKLQKATILTVPLYATLHSLTVKYLEGMEEKIEQINSTIYI
jgi:hypothetical protein